MGRGAVNVDDLKIDGPVDDYGFPILDKESGPTSDAVDAAPIQRMLGGYLPIDGRPGWFTREMTLRQEIELADMADELQFLAGAKPSAVLRAALPIARMIIFRKNRDGDIVPVTEDDLLDNFRANPLMDIVKSVSGFGATEGKGNPTLVLPTTETSSAG